MAKRKSQADHDILVAAVAWALEGKGYKNIKADIESYSHKPDKILFPKSNNGHIPDVTAENDKFVIVEVETADSITDSHTESQWNLFAQYSKSNNCDFHIVVPRNNREKVLERLKELDIKANVWEIT